MFPVVGRGLLGRREGVFPPGNGDQISDLHQSLLNAILVLASPGSPDTLPFPRLPEPPLLGAPQVRRKTSEQCPLPAGAVERPQTLAFAPRPRPASGRHRLDPWKLVSFGRTQRETSSPGEAAKGNAVFCQTLLDIDMEGQHRDCTEPLCRGQAPCCNLQAEGSH